MYIKLQIEIPQGFLKSMLTNIFNIIIYAYYSRNLISILNETLFFFFLEVNFNLVKTGGSDSAPPFQRSL